MPPCKYLLADFDNNVQSGINRHWNIIAAKIALWMSYDNGLHISANFKGQYYSVLY